MRGDLLQGAGWRGRPAYFERCDFLNAWKHTAPADNMPQMTLHAFDTGPFEGGQKKLKNVYVATDIEYDKLN